MNIEDVEYIYTMGYYSAIKNEIMPFATTWMDLEMIKLSEESEKERCIPYDITYMWNLKYDANKPIYANEQDRLTDIENRLVKPRGKERGRELDWELGLTDANVIYRMDK